MNGRMLRRGFIPKTDFGKTIISMDFHDWWNLDGRIYPTIQHMIDAGAVERNESGKLRLVVTPNPSFTPWYQIVPSMTRDCSLWHEVYFNNFHFVPKGCMNCWKVVIKVKSVFELFKLKDLLIELNLPSKCGVDVRKFTNSVYIGFFYTNSPAEGKVIYDKVAPVLKEAFPKAPVILKRGCTEMEMEFPPSSSWRYTPNTEHLERQLNSVFIETPNPALGPQMALLKSNIFRFWLDHAYSIGDNTWSKVLDSEGYIPPKHLYPPAETYHTKSVEEIHARLNEGG